MSDGQTSVINHLVAENKLMLEALVEISKGEGRYSRDQLEHAANTIEDMQAIARTAISNATPEEAK